MILEECNYKLKGESKMSWFSNVENWFKKEFSGTSWETTAQTTIAYVSPLLDTIVGYAAGTTAATKVQGVITQVQNDLAAVKTLIQGSSDGSAKADVKGLLTTIQSNLATLLADADVKNSTLGKEITAGVTIVSGELTAILNTL
jgi:hypothetical protein